MDGWSALADPTRRLIVETLLEGVQVSKAERGKLLQGEQAGEPKKTTKPRRVRPKPEAGLSPA